MVSTNAIRTGATVQAPPIVAELKRVFESLDDSPLLSALMNRRGPKGHGERTLWRCMVMKYFLALPSTAAMIRTLNQNPWIAQACGAGDAIPHKASFSRFFIKLSKRKYLPLVKDVSRRLVRKHYDTLPGFGQRVALDSSTLKGFVNGNKTKPSDKQAGWSVKMNTHGKQAFTLGWKLHLAVDAESQLPISANISPGNIHDASRVTNLLSEARFTTGRFHPKFLLADKGYSGIQLYYHIKWQYRTQPIIDPNPMHKKFANLTAEMRQTPGWKALYKQRTSVERAFSQLKRMHSLNHITVRGWRKVTAHCYLSLIALQASHALG